MKPPGHARAAVASRDPILQQFAVQAATQRTKLANAPTVLRRLAVENMQRRRRAFTGAELTANGGPSDVALSPPPRTL